MVSLSGSSWAIEVFWKRLLMSLFTNHFVEELHATAKKLKSKNMIFHIQIVRTALFPAPRGHLKKVDNTWISQIDKLEKQNPNLTINVFEWEKEHVIVPRISEKDGAILRINVMITQRGDNTIYRLTALLYDQIKTFIRKNLWERGLHV